jgi:hypothetical protein
MLLLTSAMVLCGNSIVYVRAHPGGGYIDGIARAVPGVFILMLFVLAGILCRLYIPVKLPASAYILAIGCILSIPGAPGSAGPVSQFMNSLSGTIMRYVGEVSFMSLATPALAYAGLSWAKDRGELGRSWWRIAIVSALVFVGTFLGSAIIADAVLRVTGQI